METLAVVYLFIPFIIYFVYILKLLQGSDQKLKKNDEQMRICH